ncbi:hypothetical protein [Sediminibacterium soli]|uniref:hypothetical protein n=1 Tax=Sediminibacterium soli TaxID=2698829 RepID=UPI0013796B9E|nr:hypothetical protein [Sediminibacterium soli]NCI45794.1 hypothetical protein [Sediminibacterium soli]
MTSYAIRINTESHKYPDLSVLFSYFKKQTLNSVWQYEITEEENDFTNAIEILTNQIEDNLNALRKLDIEIDDVSLWYLYEYDGQCNMEFSPAELSAISKLGLTLCISCWEK